MQMPGVQSTAPEYSPGSPAAPKLERAAADFEALLIAQMLKSARESSAANNRDEEQDESNTSLMELGEQQFAQSLSAAGALGIAKMIVTGLSRNADR